MTVRRIGRIEIPGGGQVRVEGQHVYVGHMKPPHGTTIVDVSDPTRPEVVTSLQLEGTQSHSHKVRVAGNLMITNVEMNNRHMLRRGAQRLLRRRALRRRGLAAQRPGRTAAGDAGADP